ncbi:ABC transporter substrate-binding protein [Pontibacillus salipaludis]|uniref:ABC transport system substrate-binding protein n=1 Tax=Pontibacillus salipaludis TaxID=1697394 RepID=A0ABQ1Q788_9BACI|nr:ABC transporter substrate-binding protein [Pontibacillus salipaludis]GGD14976.1 hypothetical protein GCM10011389_23270 [Pontibacillus salipaludis]
MKKISWLLMLMMLGSLLVLAACGSDEETESDSGETEDTTDTEETSGDATSDGETYQIGVTQIVEHPSLDAAFEGFKTAMDDAGVNAEYDVQIAQGDQSNNQTIATNFVGDQMDLIFANSTPSAQGALNATPDIPIIFTSVSDPVGAELVPSMDEAGGNITGTTDNHPEAIPSTVDFISNELGAKKVGMIYNSGEQNSIAQIDLVKKAMEGTDLEIVERSVSTSAEVQQAAEALVGKADVFYIITDNTVVSALESVISVANDQDIPVVAGEFDSVERGALAAYGFDYYDIGYQSGEMAAKVLKGEAEISSIAPEVPGNLKLVMNKTAAEEQGVEIKPEWEEKAEFVE